MRLWTTENATASHMWFVGSQSPTPALNLCLCLLYCHVNTTQWRAEV